MLCGYCLSFQVIALPHPLHILMFVPVVSMTLGGLGTQYFSISGLLTCAGCPTAAGCAGCPTVAGCAGCPTVAGCAGCPTAAGCPTVAGCAGCPTAAGCPTVASCACCFSVDFDP